MNHDSAASRVARLSARTARDGSGPRGLSGWAGRLSRAGLGGSLAAVRLGRDGRLRRAGFGVLVAIIIIIIFIRSGFLLSTQHV